MVSMSEKPQRRHSEALKRKSLLSSRQDVKANIDANIMACRKCPGLNLPGDTEAACGYGNLQSPIMLVGQSMHAYNPETPERQIPFLNASWVEHAGLPLFQALEEAGIRFEDVFTTNVVHCHPPRNRPCTSQEAANCRQFLMREISLVRPRLVICLGMAAGEALDVPTRDRICRLEIDEPACKHTCWATLVLHPAYIVRVWKEDRDQYQVWARYLAYLVDRFMLLGSKRKEPQ